MSLQQWASRNENVDQLQTKATGEDPLFQRSDLYLGHLRETGMQICSETNIRCPWAFF